MMTADQPRSRWPIAALACFLGLVVLFDAPLDAITIRAGRSNLMNNAVVYAIMWMPGLAAILTCLVFRRRVMELGFAWPAARYGWAGYWLPFVYATSAYVVLWSTGLAPPQFAVYAASAAKELGLGAWSAPLSAVLIATIVVIRSCSSALGEEIGWRGFLVPALAERMTFLPLVLASGLIWAAWHFPMILFGDYTSGAPAWVTMPCFTIFVTSLGGIAAWLRLRSGSIWPAVLLHGTQNAIVQALFDPLTVETGRAAWFASEFGIGLAVTATLTFVVLVRFGGVPATGRRERGLASA